MNKLYDVRVCFGEVNCALPTLACAHIFVSVGRSLSMPAAIDCVYRVRDELLAQDDFVSCDDYREDNIPFQEWIALWAFHRRRSSTGFWLAIVEC